MAQERFAPFQYSSEFDPAEFAAQIRREAEEQKSRRGEETPTESDCRCEKEK
ncbi:hypothetical protein [Corynebacterium poyangense]|uniref:hypothetical protein n=1 Tax=Corynebacterium poyangense TaxID=2684405 RepID=UPI001CCBDBDC|nr:hypothetical protein [Corynebacterium poyangense]